MEENILLDCNPEPQHNAHKEKDPEFKKILSYIIERKFRGPDLSDEFALFCLSSYFILKQDYEEVCHRYELPTKTFLTDELFLNFRFLPGIRDITLELFKVKTELCHPNTKICLLLTDEHVLTPEISFPIKYGEMGYNDAGIKPAHFVTTIWVSPININCAIPLAYYFTHESCPAELLKHNLFEAINKLNYIDIAVVGVVAKVNRNIIELCQILNISAANPSFEFQDRNIVFLYDTHHLINITYNNFMTHKFDYKGMYTSLKHIEELFTTEWECFNGKITTGDLLPDKVPSPGIEYATEFFSDHTASVMIYKISKEQIPASALGTAQTIDLFDRFFKIMNSSHINLNNELDSGYCGTKLQGFFMKQMIHFFENLKIFDNEGNDRSDQLIFKNAWIISIKGIMQLWEGMKLKNCPRLMTSFINCEQIDVFLRAACRDVNCYSNPTPWKFMIFYERFFVNNYLSYWPYDEPPVEHRLDIDTYYTKKVFNRIPGSSDDRSSRTKVCMLGHPETKNSGVYFADFLDAWADHCNYVNKKRDDEGFN